MQTIKGQEYFLNAALKGGGLATLYVGVGTVDPATLTETSTSITEVTDTAYVRKPITSVQWSVLTQNASNQTQVSNAVAVTLNNWAANQVTSIKTFGLFSALTGGDLLYHDALRDTNSIATPLTPVAGQGIEFAIGAIKIAQNTL